MMIAAETTRFLGQVEDALKAALAEATPGQEPPGEMAITAARHLCIGGGGKRIRPLLVHYFAQALGVAPERVVDAGVAAELVHSASLLHDDVVDNGMFRRGRPTVNSLWGNVVAVMSGDMVLTLALAQLAREDVLLMQDALACVAEMTRGTIVELEARGDLDLSLEKMRFIAEAKTGALFGWCGLAAARIGRSDEARPRFAEFGRRMGVAFQIADDIRDLTGDDAGKPRFADLAAKNPSLPILIGARADAALKKRITDAWAFGAMTPDRVRDLGLAVLATDAVEQSVRRMKAEIQAAREVFAPYASAPGGRELMGWAEQLYCAFDERGIDEGASVDRGQARQHPQPSVA